MNLVQICLAVPETFDAQTKTRKPHKGAAVIAASMNIFAKIVGSSKDLDQKSSQGHINIHSTCRTSTMPNHVTVASRTTEIWPFEFCEISTFVEVCTLVIAVLEGNCKIGLKQAIDQVPYYD